VYVIARAFSQPFLHLRMFVSAAVIQHEVNLEGGIEGLINPVEESQKLLI
jgi:hypothetical protein